MIVIIENVKFEAMNFSISGEDGSREFAFDFKVVGENNYHLVNNLLNSRSVFEVEIPENGIELKAKKGNYSSSYQEQLNDRTIVGFTINMKEINPNEDPEWDLMTGVYGASIMNWVRARALSELLSDKGIINIEEYVERIELVRERDWESLSGYFKTGKLENEVPTDEESNE